MSTGQLSAHEEGRAYETKELLRSHSPSSPPIKPVHKARWLTPEFLAYFAFLAGCYWLGGGLVWDLSKNANPRLHYHLRPGWMFGRRIDLSDGQYRFFREELPLLTLAAVGFLVLSHAVRHFSKNSLRARLYFYATFSFGFLLFANGSCTVFMLAIISVNYLISSLGARGYVRACTVLSWVFGCVILLLNERYNGYKWAHLLGVGGLGGESWDSPLGQAAKWLDVHRGLFGWHTLFNLVVLRMISFNMDRTWASQGRPILERDGTILSREKHARKCADCRAQHGVEDVSSSSDGPACPWWREKEHQPLALYSPLTYFVYLFYVPLHFAGPTITFNSFISHVRFPQRSYTPSGVVKYALLKTAFIFLVLEWWLHYFYVFAFTNSSAFLSLSPYEMALVSYFTLVGIWLKFTALWRFFRCWALADGIEAPENMNRCVSNNYSIQSFWRAWHRSFNRWLVRYVYVPLGGGGGNGASTSVTSGKSEVTGASAAGLASPGSPAAATVSPATASSAASSSSSRVRSVLRQSLNVFVTFSFVAFWHDRTMQLLAWGWLIALLFIPELAAQAVFNTPALRDVKKQWYWRHIQGVGAALSIFTMMVANLIGYSVGLHGTSSILSTLVTQGGVSMFVVIFMAFYSAAMIMFEFRATGITVD